jgi:hypothetical protein
MHRHARETALALALCVEMSGAAVRAQTAAAPAPVCEPRSTAAPGRLNVSGHAGSFGMIPPCEGGLGFSIARNTPLRSFEGTILVRGPSGAPPRAVEMRLDLSANATGMLIGEHRVARVPDLRCIDLSITLVVSRCEDARGARIGCPAIRVTRTSVFERLSVAGEGLDICRDAEASRP